MQKLSKRQNLKSKSLRSKNTPKDTPLVLGSCDPVLNNSNGVVNSVRDRKTFDNNSEVDHSQHKGSRNLRVFDIVYVFNMRGKPLMPTRQQKANKLLKKGEAIVVKRFPFTIQLKKPTGENKQEVEVGIDIGYKNVGILAKTDKKEVFAGELEMRTDIVKLNKERSMYRREKRNKHHWYRPARFLNRKNRKTKVPPSIQHKIDSHIQLVEKVAKLLPVSKITVEKAKFDIQKVKNPEIKGVEYQNGSMKGFNDDVKAYVRARDDHKCMNKNCKHKKDKNLKLEVHHIDQQKDGGSDRPENLITLCEFCHEDFHNGLIKLNLQKPKSYKEATCMNMIRDRIVNRLREIYDKVEVTFGTETKRKRLELGLKKSHINDAFVIAGGTNQKRSEIFCFKQRRRNNRGIQINRNGFKPAIRAKRYPIKFGDLVEFENKKYISGGCKDKGRYVILKIDKEYKNAKFGLVKLIKHCAGINCFLL